MLRSIAIRLKRHKIQKAKILTFYCGPARLYSAQAEKEATASADAVEAGRLRYLFDEYGRKLAVKSLDDWYTIGKKALAEVGAPSSLINVKHGLRTALTRAYPEHKWEFWRFSRRPWNSVETQRQFLQHLCDNVFKFKSMDDWYNMKISDIVAQGGSGMLQNHGNSLIRALQSAFPEHEWEEWRFVQVPKGFWKDPTNITRFFKWIMVQLEFDSMEAWYNVTPENIRALGAEKIIERDFNGSIHAALRSAFPAHQWHAWRFAHYETPLGFWKDIANQRAFFEWVSQDLGFNGNLAGFYDVTGISLREKGGVFIHHRYGGNLASALVASYPDHSWQIMRFVKASGRPENAPPPSQGTHQGNFIANLGRELGISSLEQWYSINLLHLRSAGILAKVWDAGGLRAALQNAYPHHCWDSATKSWETNSTSALINLAKQICLDLLSSRNLNGLVLINFKHPILQFKPEGSRRRKQVVFDLIIPEYKLAATIGKISDRATNNALEALCNKEGIARLHLEDWSPSSIQTFVSGIEAHLPTKS